MSLFPEREAKVKSVEERPEDVQPLTIERKEVVSPIPTQFKKQVVSDSGQKLIQTPQTQAVTIQLPADPSQLTAIAKGSVDDSLTWFAAFWLRVFKKAVRFGWKVVTKFRSDPTNKGYQ